MNSLHKNTYSKQKLDMSRRFMAKAIAVVALSAGAAVATRPNIIYVNAVDFVDDGTRYKPVLTIDSGSYTFSNNVKIMFECDASGNRDDVYIDNVRISAQ